MKKLDELIINRVDSGYVYFVYSKVVKKVYVGESDNINRINIYKSIIEEVDSKKRIMLYNFYTKHKNINLELAYDIVDKKNEFKIDYINTKFHKFLEKSYIRFFLDNGIDLYNRKLYKKHEYDLSYIDLKYIDILK